jgi:hypothetical protein
MTDIEGLRRLRGERFFAGWDGFVGPEIGAASEARVRRLIDDLIALGPELSETAARHAVDECLQRFNRLAGPEDDEWIDTIERENIYRQVCSGM